MALLIARCYTAPLKPVITRQYFHKILQSPNTNLAPILQSSNTNLTLFYKTQILIWHLYYKAQILFWHYFTEPKFILAIIYKSPKYYFGKNNYIMLKAQNYLLAKYILKSLTHGKYKLLISQKYFFSQNL